MLHAAIVSFPSVKKKKLWHQMSCFFEDCWHFKYVHFFYIAFRNVTKVHDEWFANEESVRKEVGLLEEPVDIPNLREVSIYHIIKFVSAMSKRVGRITAFWLL
jgi:hypothetical protein